MFKDVKICLRCGCELPLGCVKKSRGVPEVSMKCRNFSLRCLCGTFELLKSVIIGKEGVLEVL